MEPNPQTVNYLPYIMAGGAALATATIAASYLAIKKIEEYERRIEDSIARTKEIKGYTKRLLVEFYKIVETHVPREKQGAVRASFRAELERRLGQEKAREYNASIVGMI